MSFSYIFFFFFSSRRRHTISTRDWSSDVCSSDLDWGQLALALRRGVGWRELDDFAGHDRRHVVLGRGLGEPPRSRLVAERAVSKDRVRADQEQRRPLELLRRVLVL